MNVLNDIPATGHFGAKIPVPVGYSLESAIADWVDNSISTGASVVTQSTSLLEIRSCFQSKGFH
jgi:hypothetical protein